VTVERKPGEHITLNRKNKVVPSATSVQIEGDRAKRVAESLNAIESSPESKVDAEMTALVRGKAIQAWSPAPIKVTIEQADGKQLVFLVLEKLIVVSNRLVLRNAKLCPSTYQSLSDLLAQGK
jgi:hypothetical protein